MGNLFTSIRIKELQVRGTACTLLVALLLFIHPYALAQDEAAMAAEAAAEAQVSEAPAAVPSSS
ncbi:MAG: hypothetical protein CSA97_03910, partial [Bacteroidetes bacterium]